MNVWGNKNRKEETKCYVPYNLYRMRIMSIRNHETFIFSYILYLDYYGNYTIFDKIRRRVKKCVQKVTFMF